MIHWDLRLILNIRLKSFCQVRHNNVCHVTRSTRFPRVTLVTRCHQELLGRVHKIRISFQVIGLHRLIPDICTPVLASNWKGAARITCLPCTICVGCHPGVCVSKVRCFSQVKCQHVILSQRVQQISYFISYSGKSVNFGRDFPGACGPQS